MNDMELAPWPRLYYGKDTALNLKDKLHSPHLQAEAAQVLSDADYLVRMRPLGEREAPSYMVGSRNVRDHMRCLTAAWVLTRKPTYRKAAIRHMANLLNWNHISCVARDNTPPDAHLEYCLEYGQQSSAIAIMYDMFRPDITPEEQQVFFDVLDKFHLKEALTAVENPPWWANTEWSNWNGVCCGGMGMLALAFYGDRPECQTLIPFVEKSLGEYFKSYIKNGGGCHEGTGYYNFAMMYAIPYLLSWESATGRKHPILEIREVGKSLHFPLDFSGITFGDNDGWGAAGYHFMLAKRLKQPKAAIRAATYLGTAPRHLARPKGRTRRTQPGTFNAAFLLYSADAVPSAETMEQAAKAHAAKKQPVARVYEGLGWAALADDEAFPSLRLAARGGSSEIRGHGMLDLMSFKCMVNGERFITDQAGGPLSVACTKRGHHLYDRGCDSKSTLFVDGLGCMENATCDATEVVKQKDLLGIRIDGSHIYLIRWRDHFIGRLILMVENRYWLIIDRAYHSNSAEGHYMEARFHTFADSRGGKNYVTLKSGQEHLTMSFAALEKSVLQESRGMPTAPAEQTTIYRWMSTEQFQDNVLVTALNPGSRRLAVKVRRDRARGYAIDVSSSDSYQRTIRVSPELKLRGASCHARKGDGATRASQHRVPCFKA